jgi:hypothetical protein
MPADYRHIVRDLLEDDRSDVISLYLPVDATDPRNQRAHGDEWWRAEARALVRQLEHDADGDKDRRTELGAAVEQLDAFTTGYVPSERSVAVFADPNGVRSLPMEVDIAPEISFGRPLVGPFARSLFAHRRYLVVLVAADKFRTVEFTLGGPEELREISFESNWDMPGETRSAHHFRAESRHEHFQQVAQHRMAERVDRLVATGDFDVVVLGGAAREAHGVFGALSQRTAERVAGIVAAPVDANEKEIAERISPLVQEYEEEHEVDVVHRILRRKATSGAGATGIANVSGVLGMHVVSRLVIASGQLDPEVRETLIRAAMRQGASLLFVFGPATEMLIEYEGVIADLHYNPFEAN